MPDPDASPKLPDWEILVESHRHGPGFRSEAHAHGFPSLIFVVSGEGTCISGGIEHALRPDSLMLLRSGEPHQLVDKPRTPMVVFVVYFSERLAQASGEVVRPLLEAAQPILLPPHYARQVRSDLRELLFEQASRPVHFRLAMQHCLASVLLRASRAAMESKGDDHRSLSGLERVRRVLEHVSTHYYDHHGLAEASRMAGLSQRQFSTLCRRLTGTSYLQHINRIRLQRALELLEGSEMSVSAVAFEVGFEELSTFYRAFRKVHGRPPLQWRRR